MHAVIRNNTERSCVPLTQFSPMVASCKTTVQYHNQDIDIATVHQSHLDLPVYFYFFVCVYVYFIKCASPTRVKLQKTPVILRISCVALLYLHPSPSSFPSLQIPKPLTGTDLFPSFIILSL